MLPLHRAAKLKLASRTLRHERSGHPLRRRYRPSRCCARLDRMEPWPRGWRCPVVGGEWSAPAHLSWVAGVGPVEPHTEVADHERVYDGNDRVGCAREHGAAGGGARGRVARREDAAVCARGDRAGGEPLAAGGPLVISGG